MLKYTNFFIINQLIVEIKNYLEGKKKKNKVMALLGDHFGNPIKNIISTTQPNRCLVPLFQFAALFLCSIASIHLFTSIPDFAVKTFPNPINHTHVLHSLSTVPPPTSYSMFTSSKSISSSRKGSPQFRLHLVEMEKWKNRK